MYFLLMFVHSLYDVCIIVYNISVCCVMQNFGKISLIDCTLIEDSTETQSEDDGIP